jgi:hypothetical protein
MPRSYLSGSSSGTGISGLEGTSSLSEALNVSGPYNVEDAPNAYSFERSNSLSLDWDLLLKAANRQPLAIDSSQLKQYVELAWDPSGKGRALPEEFKSKNIWGCPR